MPTLDTPDASLDVGAPTAGEAWLSQASAYERGGKPNRIPSVHADVVLTDPVCQVPPATPVVDIVADSHMVRRPGVRFLLERPPRLRSR